MKDSISKIKPRNVMLSRLGSRHYNELLPFVENGNSHTCGVVAHYQALPYLPNRGHHTCPTESATTSCYSAIGMPNTVFPYSSNISLPWRPSVSSASVACRCNSSRNGHHDVQRGCQDTAVQRSSTAKRCVCLARRKETDGSIATQMGVTVPPTIVLERNVF